MKQDLIGQEYVFDWSFLFGIKSEKNNFGMNIFYNHQSYWDSVLGNWADDGGAPGRNSGRDALGINFSYKF